LTNLSWLSAAFCVNATDNNLTTQPPDRKAKQRFLPAMPRGVSSEVSSSQSGWVVTNTEITWLAPCDPDIDFNSSNFPCKRPLVTYTFTQCPFYSEVSVILRCPFYSEVSVIMNEVSTMGRRQALSVALEPENSRRVRITMHVHLVMHAPI